MSEDRLRKAISDVELALEQVKTTGNSHFPALSHTFQAFYALVGDNSDLERTQMVLEDLSSAYTQLQRNVKWLQTGREKALLAQKLRTVEGKCGKVDDFSQLQGLYEEVSVEFWLASRDFSPSNKPFQDFIHSILSEKRENNPENDKLNTLLEETAKLKREIRSKDVIIAMCRSEINKLSTHLSPILGISLPLIEKYPELELPQLCQSLFQALSKGKKPTRRTYSDWERVEITTQQAEKPFKTMEMDLEELMFERDLARQQNAILRQGEMAVLGRFQAQEKTIRREIEQIACEKAAILTEKAAILTAKRQLNPKTREIGTNTLASGLIPANRRLHASFSARNLSPEAVSKAAEVLEKAHQHLDILERHWNSLSSRKLKESKKERKGSISQFPETEEPAAKLKKASNEVRVEKKGEMDLKRSMFEAKGSALAWGRDWSTVKSSRNAQETLKVARSLIV